MPVKPRKTWKYFIRSYLYFPKWQRRSLVIIWLGLIAAFISKYFYIQAAFKKEPALPAILQAELEELNTDADSMDMATPQLYEPQPTTHYTREMPKGLTPIAFDPNTVSPEVLAKMGLRQKAIENIINYRNRGGRFKQPEDLNKLYGLLPHEKAALIPFASIAAVSYPTTTGPPKPDSMARVQQRQQAAAERVARLALDINGANQEAWEALPGIGPALAARILKFRNSLGGFYSINQVAETFGLPDSTFDRIRPYLQLQQAPELQKLAINQAGANQLRQHPYISYKQAQVIEQYRQQHGPFLQAKDLLRIHVVDEAWLKKLAPYLSFE